MGSVDGLREDSLGAAVPLTPMWSAALRLRLKRLIRPKGTVARAYVVSVVYVVEELGSEVLRRGHLARDYSRKNTDNTDILTNGEA